MNIGEQLQQLRNNKNVTQAEVAEELIVSRQTISSWENGKSYPDIEMLIHLSEYYHVTIDELIKGDVKMKQNIEKNSMDDKQKRLFLVVNTIGLLIIVLPKRLFNLPENLGEFISGVGASIIIVNMISFFLPTIFPNIKKTKRSFIKKIFK